MSLILELDEFMRMVLGDRRDGWCLLRSFILTLGWSSRIYKYTDKVKQTIESCVLQWVN